MKMLNRLDLGVPCLRAGFAGEQAYFLAMDGRLHVQHDDQRRVVALHDGDVLSACAAPGEPGAAAWLLSAGEDGRVMRAGAGEPDCVASVPNKWVTALAVAADGALAYASGRTVWLAGRDGEPPALPQERPVQALRFSHGGRWLAVAGYDGLTLYDRQAGGEPQHLSWKGMPTRVAFSPDDRFVLVATRDAVLHGWRLDTLRHFRMVGYPRAVGSWSWLAGGQWLVTDGSAGAVLWPFEGEEGPIGSTPLALGERPDGEVSAVACHPARPWVAVGYADGLMVLESTDGALRRILGQAGRDRVACLAWDRAGARLAYGTPSGACGVIGAVMGEEG